MDLQMLKKQLSSMSDYMTSYERSIAYNNGEEVDYLPFSFPWKWRNISYTIRIHTSNSIDLDFEIHCHIMECLNKEFGIPFAASAKLGLKGIGEA